MLNRGLNLIVLIFLGTLSPLQAKDSGVMVLGVIASTEDQKGIALVKIERSESLRLKRVRMSKTTSLSTGFER